MIQSGMHAGLVTLVSFSFTSCASRDHSNRVDRVQVDSSAVIANVRALEEVPSTLSHPDADQRPKPLRLDSTATVAIPREASPKKAPDLEEWMALQLGPGLSVRRAYGNGLILSRLKSSAEPLPLFEEAIVLGELRAIVRASEAAQSGDVTFRNGCASVTVQEPLRSRGTVDLISKIMQLPEISELRVRSLPVEI